MENKINIAELLKDCPKGMELDCTKYSNVYFVGIDDSKKEPKIKLKIETLGTWCSELTLDKYGKESSHPNAKCLIFPKGKTTWEGFVPPCKFKDGDVIFTHTNATKGLLENSWVSIFKEYRNNRCACYVCLCLSDLELYYDKWENELLCELCEIEKSRLATEEEKAKLFQSIKDNGYKWNPETKTLENLIKPKFKVGDRIKSIYNTFQYDIKELTNTHYTLIEVKDKFKYVVPIVSDKNWELIFNKFDISKLKPFDKVLVRDTKEQVWVADLFSHMVNRPLERYKFACVGHYPSQCIPYEGNEHLLGTTNDCDDYFRTWE